MNDLKNKVVRFLSQRYGNDALNAFLFWVAVILFIVNFLLFDSYWIRILIQAVLIVTIYRSLSRKYAIRQQENNLFLQFTKRIRHTYLCIKRQSKDPNNKYFVCPYCAQISRIPKGRGNVEIICPKCKRKFDKRS